MSVDPNGPNGTFDMGGNVHERFDRISFNRREHAGGAFAIGAAMSSVNNGAMHEQVPWTRTSLRGFRLV